MQIKIWLDVLPAMPEGDHSLYRVYLFLKMLDRLLKKSGRLPRGYAEKWLADQLGQSPASIRKLVQQGVRDGWWHVRRDRIIMIGFETLCRDYSVEPSSRHILTPAWKLRGRITNFRDVILQGHVDALTQEGAPGILASAAELADELGMSRSTLFRKKRRKVFFTDSTAEHVRSKGIILPNGRRHQFERHDPIRWKPGEKTVLVDKMVGKKRLYTDIALIKRKANVWRTQESLPNGAYDRYQQITTQTGERYLVVDDKVDYSLLSRPRRAYREYKDEQERKKIASLRARFGTLANP